MSTLKFTDGEEFDVTGPLRLEKRYDGWYVLGNNRMVPVRDEKEGLEIIKNSGDIVRYTGEQIIEDGVLIEKWACDVNYEGEMESNGSQEFYYEYNGENYVVWMDWNDQPLDPRKPLSPIKID